MLLPRGLHRLVVLDVAYPALGVERQALERRRERRRTRAAVPQAVHPEALQPGQLRQEPQIDVVAVAAEREHASTT
jgi:hypothetical protein